MQLPRAAILLNVRGMAGGLRQERLLLFSSGEEVFVQIRSGKVGPKWVLGGRESAASFSSAWTSMTLNRLEGPPWRQVGLGRLATRYRSNPVVYLHVLLALCFPGHSHLSYILLEGSSLVSAVLLENGGPMPASLVRCQQPAVVGMSLRQRQIKIL